MVNHQSIYVVSIVIVIAHLVAGSCFRNKLPERVRSTVSLNLGALVNLSTHEIEKEPLIRQKRRAISLGNKEIS